MRYRVPYPNPDYNDESLFIKEIVNGTFYQVVDQQRKKNRVYSDRYNMNMTNLILDGGTKPANFDMSIEDYSLPKSQEWAWLPHWIEEEDTEIEPLHNDYSRGMIHKTVDIHNSFNLTDYNYISYDGSGAYYTKDGYLYYIDVTVGSITKMQTAKDTNFSGGYGYLIDLDTHKIYFTKNGTIIKTSFQDDNIQVFSNKTYGYYLIAKGNSFKIVDMNQNSLNDEWIDAGGIIEKFVMLKKTPYIVINAKRYLLIKDANKKYSLQQTKYYFEYISKYDFLGGNRINYYLKKQGYFIKIVDVIDVLNGEISVISEEETDDIQNILVALPDNTKVTYTAYYTDNLEAGSNIFKRNWKLLPKISGKKYPVAGVFGSIKQRDDNTCYFEYYKYK